MRYKTDPFYSEQQPFSCLPQRSAAFLQQILRIIYVNGIQECRYTSWDDEYKFLDENRNQ